MLATAAILFAYQVVFVIVALSLYPDWFNDPRRLSADVDAAIRRAPAPVFMIGVPRSNELFYLKWPIQALSPADSTLTAPAWVLARRSDLEELAALRADLSAREVAVPSVDLDFALARIEWRQGTVP